MSKLVRKGKFKRVLLVSSAIILLVVSVDSGVYAYTGKSLFMGAVIEVVSNTYNNIKDSLSKEKTTEDENKPKVEFVPEKGLVVTLDPTSKIIQDSIIDTTLKTEDGLIDYNSNETKIVFWGIPDTKITTDNRNLILVNPKENCVGEIYSLLIDGNNILNSPSKTTGVNLPNNEIPIDLKSILENGTYTVMIVKYYVSLNDGSIAPLPFQQPITVTVTD